MDNTTTNLGKRIRFRFGTWNVKSLYQVGKLAQAGRILERYGLNFMGMSEVRWNQCGQIVTTNGHLMLWSGMPNENDVWCGDLDKQKYSPFCYGLPVYQRTHHVGTV